MRIVKIWTDCNFAGCSSVHFVRVPDDASKSYLDELAEEFVNSDVAPECGWEESSIEEAEEEYETIEDLTDEGESECDETCATCAINFTDDDRED